METNANANEALSRANTQANDGLRQLQSNFALVLQMFQDQVTHEIEVSSSKTQSYFETLIKGIDAAVQSIISKIGSRMTAMESDAANLSEVSQAERIRFKGMEQESCIGWVKIRRRAVISSGGKSILCMTFATFSYSKASSSVANFHQNVHKANIDSANLEKNIGKVFQQVLTGSAELAATQSEQWDLSRVMATELQGSLQSMKEGEIESVLGALASIRGQLVSKPSELYWLVVTERS